MLRRASQVVGFSIHATDGDIGHVRDLYFDDQQWLVRYLVVDTGHWLPGRQVLVSPRAVTGLRWRGRRLDTLLTRDEVRASPTRDADKPVSRQHEAAPDEYLYVVVFWTEADLEKHPQHEGDPHLRSLRRMSSYTGRVADADVGHVADVLVDDAGWVIRYLVLDLRRWWLAKHVLVPVALVAGISWVEKAVHLRVTADAVRTAPAYALARRLSQADETRLLAHYGDLPAEGRGDCRRR